MNPGQLYPTSRVSRLLAALALSAAVGISAFAQAARGTMTGHAADRAGAVLQGAQVKLEPGDITTSTDSQGQFRFIGLRPGNYTLTISYIGFADFTQQVNVTGGEENRIEARMDIAVPTESVKVVAELPHGEAEAINRERVSDNLLQVIPSSVIMSLPNENIADAVGRLPGVSLERDEGEGKYVQVRGTEPRLNNTTVDGVEIPAPEDNVRQFKLDTIPADIIESIEVNKTLSASQDADAIGGTVNLVTKKAGDLPTLTLEGIGGFTPIENTRYIGLVTGTIGQRFGVSKKFGALFSGSYDYNGRGIDDIEPSPNDTAVPSYGSMDIREYRYQRKRYGFGGTLDYKLSEASGVFAHYFDSDFKDYGNKWKYTLNDGGSPQFSTSSRLPDYGIIMLAIGGKHIFTNSWLSWEISAARSRQLAAAGNPGATFDPVPGSPLSNLTSCVNLPSSDIHLPQWSPQCFGSPTYDPSQYTLTEYDGTTGITSQVNLQGTVSNARNYHLGSHFSTFEYGFKIRNAHKGQNAYSPTYDQTFIPNPNNPPVSLMTNYLDGFTNANYYFHAYPLGPVTNYNTIVNNLNSVVGQGVLALDEPSTLFGSVLSNFDLTERVSAGYVMNTIEFGRFRLQTGLRIEATQLNILGFSTTNNSSSTAETVVPEPSQSWYWDPLPNAQLRFAISTDSDIRAVYGRGISRPNPYDMVPYVTVDQSTNPYTVDIGNPNLKPEHANNYDVLYERYLKPYGELQAGFFYKQLSQPIYYILDPHYQGTQYPEYVGDNFSYIINGVNGKLYGVEFAYIQRLGFLPGFLSGFGITANYSKTGSSAGTLPLRNDDPALQRQTPTMWNLSPTYDRGRFSARIGATYNSASIYQYQWEQCTAQQSQLGVCEDPAGLGPNGPLGDNYLYAHLQVDAQASYRVQKNFTVLVQGLNLTDEVFGFFNGSPWYLTQREYYHPTYSFGLRWEPRREN
jgi:outer membrane receptor protein involved in Fe transport